SALRLDIDTMTQWGAIRPSAHLIGEMRLNFYDGHIDVSYESQTGDPWDSWLRLRYSMADYCSGEEPKIDDKVSRAHPPTFRGAAMVVRGPASKKGGAQ